MVAFDSNIALGASLRKQLLAIQKTTRQLDIASNRLSTGRKVNSAIDDPNNFFASRSLVNQADDYSRLLDSINQNVQTIKQAQNGLTGIENLLKLAEALSVEALEAIGGANSSTGVPLPDQILALNPGAYWQLDDVNLATNQGSIGGVNGTPGAGVTFGGAPLYAGGGASASFDGTAGAVIAIPDSNQINTTAVSQRTVEMTINANDVISRQVLYEEGATVNSVAAYIDNGRVYFAARDQGDFGPFNISAPIQAGETYHISFVIDAPSNEFRGYVNGNLVGTGAMNIPLSAHSGDVGIGGARGGLWFHDGSTGGNGFNYNGSISDVALYNTVLADSVISDHAAATQEETLFGFDQEFSTLLQQIDEMASDSSYRGTNLLLRDSIDSVFNPEGTSIYTSNGDDFTSQGLGLSNLSLDSSSDIQLALSSIRSAIDRVRDFQSSFSTDINVLETREAFSRNKINTNLEGSDKLTLADLNEESAKLLSAQTIQNIQFATLASQNRQPGIVELLFGI